MKAALRLAFTAATARPIPASVAVPASSQRPARRRIAGRAARPCAGICPAPAAAL